jgi:hypothetical protein
MRPPPTKYCRGSKAPYGHEPTQMEAPSEVTGTAWSLLTAKASPKTAGPHSQPTLGHTAWQSWLESLTQQSSTAVST